MSRVCQKNIIYKIRKYCYNGQEEGDGKMNKDYDRVDVNESDGQSFYGYDNDDNTTSWYDSAGNLDSITRTPSDE